MPHEPFRPHMAVIRGVQSPRDKIVLARGHYPCPGCALDRSTASTSSTAGTLDRSLHGACTGALALICTNS